MLLLLAIHGISSSAQTINLTAEKNVYLEDDVRAFHGGAILAPSGERVLLHAVIEGLAWTGQECPSLTQRVRLPDGTERDDDLRLRARCSQDQNGRMEVKFDAGHISYWNGLGQYHIQLVLGDRHKNPNQTFPTSNDLVLTMADAAEIERNWGPKDHGVALDLSLDKETFDLGEDVALHIALENFDATVPIYGFSPLWDPFDAVKIEIHESDGKPVTQTCARAWTSGGPAAMWRYPAGMIVPVERSLTGDGILPDHPGVFTVRVTWNAFRGDDDSCHACQVSDTFDFTKPYVVVRSQLKSFKIKDGTKPAIPCL